MPPYAVEPGTRLVDRYRLEEHLGEAGGTSYWRAQDELLDRSVGVCLLGGGSEGAQAMLEAARQAAALTDPRFLRVLDASETADAVYVVTEWVEARSLADLLATGPLPPAEARAVAAEVAGALAAAHQQGLAHLCLQPEHVLRTAHGQVKVSGLAVDAAVRGVAVAGPQEAAERDARGAAAVLYAALTARWPLDGPTALPEAPRDAGELCSPRQVRAGIPDDLDDLTCRALGGRRRGNGHGADGAVVASPAELAAELERTQATTRLPVVTLPPPPEPRDGDDTPFPPYGAYAPFDDRAGRPARLVTRLAWAAAALVLVVGLGLAAWQLVTATGGPDQPDEPKASGTESTAPASAPERLEVSGVATLDPPPDGNGEENGDRAERVADGDESTSWNSQTYRQQFGPGGIKDGVGLLLDLGQARTVANVSVALEGSPTGLELRVADQEGAALADYRRVAGADGVSGSTTLRPDQEVRARYLLLWFTELPQADGGYRAEVSEVVVRGR